MFHTDDQNDRKFNYWTKSSNIPDAVKDDDAVNIYLGLFLVKV